MVLITYLPKKQPRNSTPELSFIFPIYILVYILVCIPEDLEIYFTLFILGAQEMWQLNTWAFVSLNCRLGLCLQRPVLSVTPLWGKGRRTLKSENLEGKCDRFASFAFVIASANLCRCPLFCSVVDQAWQCDSDLAKGTSSVWLLLSNSSLGFRGTISYGRLEDSNFDPVLRCDLKVILTLWKLDNLS